MSTIIVPVYAELASFGQGGTLVTFLAKRSFLEASSRKRTTKYAALLGRRYPKDISGGGVVALAQPLLTFTYYMLGNGPGDIQALMNTMEAQLQAANTDGTSGEVNPLSVLVYSGADATTQVTASCPARFEDMSPNVNDRGPYSWRAHISFTQLGDFTF